MMLIYRVIDEGKLMKVSFLCTRNLKKGISVIKIQIDLGVCLVFRTTSVFYDLYLI